MIKDMIYEVSSLVIYAAGTYASYLLSMRMKANENNVNSIRDFLITVQMWKIFLAVIAAVTAVLFYVSPGSSIRTKLMILISVYIFPLFANGKNLLAEREIDNLWWIMSVSFYGMTVTNSDTVLFGLFSTLSTSLIIIRYFAYKQIPVRPEITETA